MKQTESPTLSHVLLRHILLRLFVPLLALGFVAIGLVGYLGVRTLINQQKLATQSVARLVDQHLEQGGKILDSVARIAEQLPEKEISVSMFSAWEAYTHFETLYYLDENSKIRLLVPFDPAYLGTDMSKLSVIRQATSNNSISISQPFISLRTGEPTVYLVRTLASVPVWKNRMVGELNLGALQRELAGMDDTSRRDSVFILDQSGTLLAHPVSSLVRQQSNMAYLEIFRRGLIAGTTLVYKYEGTWVVGSAARIDRVGWVVVDQIPLTALLGPYVITLALTLAVSLVIWLTLMWNLRKRLYRNVVSPLVQLGENADALAMGDFSHVNSTVPAPAAFAELDKLSYDFQRMSNGLHARQAALQASEEKYRNLFDEVPVGVFRTTTEGHILDVNPATVHLLGYPNREELLATNALDTYESSESRQRWRAIADDEGVTNDFETRMRKYNGEIIWVRLNSRAIFDGADRTLCYEGTIEDITERKRAEEALRSAQEELVRKEKLAILGRLAGTVGHEIRNPLGVMNNAVYFLKTIMSDADSVVKEYLDMIKQEIVKSERIIADLLDFARTKTPQLSMIAVNTIVTQTLGQCSINENIEVRTDIPDVLPAINVDPFQIGQVFQNLITNAVQAMPGGGTLRISARPVPGFKFQVLGSNLAPDAGNLKPDADFIEISIEDTGEGISPENMEKLFQPLFTTKAKGIGLGLVVCKNLVEANGGRIDVESKPGEGTTFRVLLRRDGSQRAEG